LNWIRRIRYEITKGYGGLDIDYSYNAWEDGEFIALFTNEADAKLFISLKKKEEIK